MVKYYLAVRNKRTSEGGSGRGKKGTNEHSTDRPNERTNKRTNEQTNEQTNERTTNEQTMEERMNEEYFVKQKSVFTQKTVHSHPN